MQSQRIECQQKGFLNAVGSGGSFAASKRPAAVRFKPSSSGGGERLNKRSADELPEPLIPASPSQDFPSTQLPFPVARPGSLTASLPLGNRRASVVAGNLLKQLQVSVTDAHLQKIPKIRSVHSS